MARNMEPLIGKRGERAAALRRRVNSPYQYITLVCFTQYMFFPIGQTCPKRLCDFYQGDRPQKNIQQNAGCKDPGGLPPLFRLRYLFEQRLHASAEAEPRDDMVHPAAARTHVHPRKVLTVGRFEIELVAVVDTAAAESGAVLVSDFGCCEHGFAPSVMIAVLYRKPVG